MSHKELLEDVKETWCVPYLSERCVSQENINDMIQALEDLLAEKENLVQENKRYREAIQKLIDAKYNCDGFEFNEIASGIAEAFEELAGESE